MDNHFISHSTTFTYILKDSKLKLENKKHNNRNIINRKITALVTSYNKLLLSLDIPINTISQHIILKKKVGELAYQLWPKQLYKNTIQFMGKSQSIGLIQHNKNVKSAHMYILRLNQNKLEQCAFCVCCNNIKIGNSVRSNDLLENHVLDYMSTYFPPVQTGDIKTEHLHIHKDVWSQLESAKDCAH
jgi:hypothetical protein